MGGVKIVHGLNGHPMPPHLTTDWGIQGVLVAAEGIVFDFLDGSRALIECGGQLPRAGLLAGQLNCHLAFHDFGRGVPFGWGLAVEN